MKGMWNTDYGDWAPRASIAWNPSANSGLPGKLFGKSKTVIRAGYALIYDRLSGGSIQHIPGQPGFNATPSAFSPSCTVGVAGCVAGDIATSIYRLGGVDGPIPVPAALPIALPTATNRYVPDVGQAGNVVFLYSPNYKAGQSHMIDFSIQRELPGNMIMEVWLYRSAGTPVAGTLRIECGSVHVYRSEIRSVVRSGQRLHRSNSALRSGSRIGLQSQIWEASRAKVRVALC